MKDIFFVCVYGYLIALVSYNEKTPQLKCFCFFLKKNLATFCGSISVFFICDTDLNVYSMLMPQSLQICLEIG